MPICVEASHREARGSVSVDYSRQLAPEAGRMGNEHPPPYADEIWIGWQFYLVCANEAILWAV